MLTFMEYTPDFYEKEFNRDEYVSELSKIEKMNCFETISISSKGFDVVGIVRQIAYRVLGLLGFERPTKPVRVAYEMLKFLHYGATHGYMKDEYVTKAIQRVRLNIERLGLTVAEPLLTPNILQDDLTRYYLDHRQELQPSIYRSRTAPTTVYNPSLFGSSYLAWAKQNNSSEKPEVIKKVLHCYRKALECHNQDENFQKALFQMLNAYATRMFDRKEITNDTITESREIYDLYNLFINYCAERSNDEASIKANDKKSNYHIVVENCLKFPEKVKSNVGEAIRKRHLEYAKSLKNDEAITVLEQSLEHFKGHTVEENQATRSALRELYEAQKSWDKIVDLCVGHFGYWGGWNEPIFKTACLNMINQILAESAIQSDAKATAAAAHKTQVGRLWKYYADAARHDDKCLFNDVTSTTLQAILNDRASSIEDHYSWQAQKPHRLIVQIYKRYKAEHRNENLEIPLKTREFFKTFKDPKSGSTGLAGFLASAEANSKELNWD